ncbi:hypothetical protein COOONC_08021, partial [Cooperia oncophora]
PLSEEKIAKAAESYRAQERTIELGFKGLNNLEQVQLKNSDALPNRTFAGVGAAEMCESGRAQCVKAFARIRPLIVVRQDDSLQICKKDQRHGLPQNYIAQASPDVMHQFRKTMSTVMSAIFCFLVREKEFVDAGRSILREYPDIR